MNNLIGSITSLVIIAIGTGLLAKATIVSKKDAIELGVPRVGGDTNEENLKLPSVQFFLRQSCIAKLGLLIVIGGIIFQIILIISPNAP